MTYFLLWVLSGSCICFSLIKRLHVVRPQRDVSQIRSTTLTQFLLNWTVAELADMFGPRNTSVAVGRPTFDVTNVEDWYQQVVMPLLHSFLPDNEFLTHPNITMAFHQVLYVVFSLLLHQVLNLLISLHLKSYSYVYMKPDQVHKQVWMMTTFIWQRDGWCYHQPLRVLVFSESAA